MYFQKSVCRSVAFGLLLKTRNMNENSHPSLLKAETSCDERQRELKSMSKRRQRENADFRKAETQKDRARKRLLRLSELQGDNFQGPFFTERRAARREAKQRQRQKSDFREREKARDAARKRARRVEKRMAVDKQQKLTDMQMRRMIADASHLTRRTVQRDTDIFTRPPMCHIDDDNSDRIA